MIKKANILSIIIPCYNDHLYVEEAVNSALNQTYSNKEIIVVDDGSNAETKAVLKKIEPRIDKLISQQNRGTGAARNFGISEASGEYILVLDADDYFESIFCEKAIAIFQLNEDVKVVSCYARWFWNKDDFQIFKPNGGKLENYLVHNAAIGTSMFKKEDWKHTGGFDEKMQGYEDWEFYLRLHENGGTTIIIPEVLFHYRKKRESRNRKANDQKHELLEYIYLKHAELYKEHYATLIHHLLNQLKNEEKSKIRRENSIDFILGSTFLWPFRYLKHKIFHT